MFRNRKGKGRVSTVCWDLVMEVKMLLYFIWSLPRSCEIIGISPFYKWDWGLERLRNLYRFTSTNKWWNLDSDPGFSTFEHYAFYYLSMLLRALFAYVIENDYFLYIKLIYFFFLSDVLIPKFKEYIVYHSSKTKRKSWRNVLTVETQLKSWPHQQIWILERSW